MSKKSNSWLRIRGQYLRDNPPNHQGYYICAICGSWVHHRVITVDHIIPRSNAHNYAHRNDYSNLQLACWNCNNAKGSKH